MRLVAALSLLTIFAACGKPPEPEPASPASKAESSGLSHRTPPPGESHPFRQGFTQRPPRDTKGLPPPAEPLFTTDEAAGLEEAARSATAVERQRAQEELRGWIETFETRAPGLGAKNLEALIAKIRGAARDAARAGRIDYRSAEALYRAFIYPNDVVEAERRYQGKVVLLTGAVAPHNMLDLADGFKLFERTPYVQQPALLATDFELSFVRCHLAAPELQTLADWQEIHVLGIVEGKERGDVILTHCVVVSDPPPSEGDISQNRISQAASASIRTRRPSPRAPVELAFPSSPRR